MGINLPIGFMGVDWVLWIFKCYYLDLNDHLLFKSSDKNLDINNPKANNIINIILDDSWDVARL